MSSVSIMALFGSCIWSESAKPDKRQFLSTVAANGRDASLSAVRPGRARALDPGGRRQSSTRVLLAARLIVSKPRPPRVLADYNEEFGYIVLGTHDVEVARVWRIQIKYGVPQALTTCSAVQSDPTNR